MMARTNELGPRCLLARWASMAGLCIGVAGCASPVVVTKPVSAGTADMGNGLAYALPKAAVRIEAKRTEVTEKVMKAAADAVSEASAEEAKASQAAAAAKSDHEFAQGVARNAREAALPKAKEREGLALALKLLRDGELTLARQATARAKARLTQLTTSGASMEETVTLSLLAPRPDPSRRFVLQPKGDITRDEVLAFKVDNGLLNNVEGTTTGQLGSILVDLAATIASAGVGGGPTMAVASTGGSDKTIECQPFAFVATFDPTDRADLTWVSKLLETRSGGTLGFCSGEGCPARDPFGTAGPGATPPKEPDSSTLPTAGVAGVVYRAPVSVDIAVMTTPAVQQCRQKVHSSGAYLSAVVPDSRSLFVLPMEAGSFTTVKTSLAFKDGTPVAVNSDRPSQLAAVAKIPVDILKAIVSVPASILKLRVDYSSEEVARIKTQSEQEQARLALLKAEQALKEEQEKVAKQTP